MKNARKLACALLVAAMLVLTVAPAYAVSVTVDSPKLYLGSTNGSNWGNTYISINDLSASSKITNVKSTDTKILKPSYLSFWSDSWTSFDYPDESSKDYSATIGIDGLKKGKASIEFKVDGKKYSKAFEVLAYANPIKTLTVTGIGKTNLKSKFAKNSYVSAKLKSDAKAGYVNVTAASGWKVTRVEWYDDGDNTRTEYYTPKGVASIKLAVPKMSKKGEYYIWMNFINTKTQAEASFTYHISK